MHGRVEETLIGLRFSVKATASCWWESKNNQRLPKAGGTGAHYRNCRGDPGDFTSKLSAWYNYEDTRNLSRVMAIKLPTFPWLSKTWTGHAIVLCETDTQQIQFPQKHNLLKNIANCVDTERGQQDFLVCLYTFHDEAKPDTLSGLSAVRLWRLPKGRQACQPRRLPWNEVCTILRVACLKELVNDEKQ